VTATGIPQGAVVNYYIADPLIDYPITVTFLPSACAAFYTSFVPAIETAAGADTSAFATISPTAITITTADFNLAFQYSMRWWFTPTENLS
jgi:hypothetical protein